GLRGLRRARGNFLALGTLVGHRDQTGDRPADSTEARRLLELTGRALKAKIERFLLQFQHFVVDLVGAKCTYIADLHITHSAMRATKRVRIGSLAAARRSASRATASVTPSSSN